jgi:TonB family protein
MRHGEFIETTKEITINYDFDKRASQPKEPASKVPTTPSEDLLKEIAAGDLFRAGPNTGVTPARIISGPDPEYSEEARRNRFQGSIELGVVVETDGMPRTVWIVRALGEGLDERAIESVRRWRFEPATRNGKAVPVLISIHITFHLF